MAKFKTDVKIGDIIHIYHMFGNSEYKDVEGVVTYFSDIAIYGTWGPDGLCFDDDWEIMEDEETMNEFYCVDIYWGKCHYFQSKEIIINESL